MGTDAVPGTSDIASPADKGGLKIMIKSPEEQLAGLQIVAEKLQALVCNCAIRPAGSDVAYLVACDVHDPSEIVFAAEGYDVWRWRGRYKYPAQTNLTADQA